MTKKNTTIKKPKIANKPSQAIFQAVADLIAVERKPQYRINMSDYHSPENGKCEVCFAGAVLAQAGNDPAVYIDPAEFDSVTQHKLYALDSFRNGQISDGLSSFGVTKLPLLLNPDSYDGMGLSVEITPYEQDKVQFKKDMKKMAMELESLGL